VCQLCLTPRRFNQVGVQSKGVEPPGRSLTCDREPEADGGRGSDVGRFFRTLKEEEVWPNIYGTLHEAQR